MADTSVNNEAAPQPTTQTASATQTDVSDTNSTDDSSHDRATETTGDVTSGITAPGPSIEPLAFQRLVC